MCLKNAKTPSKSAFFGLFFQFYSTLPPSLEQKVLSPPCRKNPNPPPAGPFSTPLLPPTTVPKYGGRKHQRAPRRVIVCLHVWHTTKTHSSVHFAHVVSCSLSPFSGPLAYSSARSQERSKGERDSPTFLPAA